MINPLLHPFSTSAPTSPRCTRSVLLTSDQKRAQPVILRRCRELSPANRQARAHSNQQRRLSRVVKCRTVDFTEFPEGMRDYFGLNKAKIPLREIHSQPGSPVIPRIEICDFGSEVITHNDLIFVWNLGAKHNNSS